jgi:ribosome-associated heat shock protein Hsp15
MRLDKVLWYLRFARTRPIAQTMAEEGHIRLNGRRVDRAHQRVAAGDVLVVPLGAGVQVVQLLALPSRRGPASEARACYRPLDGGGDLTIAAGNATDAA